MIYTDESTVKIDAVVLPGLFKSIEIKGDAIVDEQDVEGQSKKPKQATGYEDIKVNIELIIDDGPLLTKIQKIEQIQQIFRIPGQEKPTVHEIINEHTAARGVKQVIFKNLTHKAENKKGQLVVTLEFWEYTVMTVTASKSASGSSGSKKAAAAMAKSNLNEDYQNYLGNRGKAPALKKSPAKDTASGAKYVATVKTMPY
ncbi:hypothetical protein K170097C1_13770 [Hungatella effluvii]|uniref:transcriptional regulator n=1 Tax=Hungatella effluvii TaxID=1096246 RepID=UPI0034C46794